MATDNKSSYATDKKSPFDSLLHLFDDIKTGQLVSNEKKEGINTDRGAKKDNSIKIPSNNNKGIGLFGAFMSGLNAGAGAGAADIGNKVNASSNKIKAPISVENSRKFSLQGINSNNNNKSTKINNNNNNDKKI
jgi:hypothetical protein